MIPKTSKPSVKMLPWKMVSRYVPLRLKVKSSMRSYSSIHPIHRNTLVALLSQIDSRQTAIEYMAHISSADKRPSAIIQVDAAALETHFDSLTSSLSFLHSLQVCPIIVHGPGPSFGHSLRKVEATFDTRYGHPVMHQTAFQIARSSILSENLRLTDALESLGAQARPIAGGVFQARYLDRRLYGQVGQITSIDTTFIKSALRVGEIPILTSLGETPDGQILYVDPEIAASELTRLLQPRKLVFCGLASQDQRTCIAMTTKVQNLSVVRVAPQHLQKAIFAREPHLPVHNQDAIEMQA